MSESIRPQDQGIPQPVPKPPATDATDLAREVEQLRKQVAHLEARLVKAHAQRNELAHELAEVRSESEIYRHAVQNLMAKDWSLEDLSMTEEEFETMRRDAVPGDQVLEEVEQVLREARKAKEARNG